MIQACLKYFFSLGAFVTSDDQRKVDEQRSRVVLAYL